MSVKYPILIKQFGKRNRELKALGFGSYAQYLKYPYWKAVKDKIAEKVRRGNTYWITCVACKRVGNINIHHVKYKKLHEVRLSTMIPLCQSCHRSVHQASWGNPKVSLKSVTRRVSRKKQREIK